MFYVTYICQAKLNIFIIEEKYCRLLNLSRYLYVIKSTRINRIFLSIDARFILYRREENKFDVSRMLARISNTIGDLTYRTKKLFLDRSFIPIWRIITDGSR